MNRGDHPVEVIGRAGGLVLAAFLAVLFLLPAASSAGWKEFLPVAVENSGELWLSASRETDDLTGTARKLRTEDLFIREKLSLSSDGYSYHPRFVQYHLGLSAALKQENYSSSVVDHVMSKATGLEYDLRLFILPEHPYSLRLFISRMEPLYKQQYATQTHNVESSRGAVFRYKLKPYFFNLRYIEEAVDTGESSSDVKTLGVNGLYFKEYSGGRKFSFSSYYDHFSYGASSGLTGTADNLGAANSIDLNSAILDSNLSKNMFRQHTLTGRVESEQLSWTERLSLKLPLNFRSVISGHYLKNSNSYGEDDSRSSTNKGYSLNVSHKLYQSLNTSYMYRRDETASNTGDVQVASHALMASYSKQIPWGTLLAGASFNRTTTDNAGYTSVVNELHTSAIGIPFSLYGENPERTPIDVYLINPDLPHNPIHLDEITHYTVTPIGNTYQITVSSLPAPFLPAGTYDFSVSYSLKSGNFKLQTTTVSYNAGLNLFNNLLNPYVASTATRSHLLAGSFTSIPVDETVTTVGLTLQKAPYRMQAEYQKSDSNITPYRLWRGEANYSASLSETMRANLGATVANKRYTGGILPVSADAYTEKTTTITASLQKYFFGRSLSLTAGGSYALFHGLVKTESYSVNSALEWKIGKLIISLGGTGYHSSTEGLLGVHSERIHQYYYANIRRRLF